MPSTDPALIYTPFIWLLLPAGAIAFALALYAWRFREASAASFAVLMLLVGSVSLCYALEISAARLSLKILLSQVRFVPSAFLSVAVLAMALDYTGQAHWLTRRRLALLMAIPAATVLLPLFPSLHQWFRSDLRMDWSGPFPVLLWTRGPWFALYIGYGVAVMLVCYGVLLSSLRSRSLRVGNTVLLLAGIAIPQIGDFLFQMGLTPIRGFNSAFPLLAVSVLCFGWALLRGKAFELAPLAHQVVIDSLDDPMLMLDPRRRVVDFNQAAHSAWGIGPDAIGRLPDSLPPAWAALMRDYDGENACRGEGEIALAGRTRAYILTLSPVRNRQGGALGHLLRGQEVTALRESERRFRDLFEQFPVAYQSLNIEGRFVDANPRLCELLGYTREELMGLAFDDVWDLETKPRFPDDLNKFMRDSRITNELCLIRKDGQPISVLLEGRIQRDADGRFMRTHCILVDITERKRLDDELAHYRYGLEALVASRTEELTRANRALAERAAQIDELNVELKRRADEAEAASRAKSRFLANMSHEIRTPMNAILGFAHLLGRSLVQPAQRERLAKIDQAGRHLLAIIDDVLDISRIEAGRLEIRETDFQPAELLGELRALVAERMEAKGLRFAAGGDRLPPTLRGDPDRLRQALLIFLDNAVKFTERGSVELDVRAMESHERDLLVRFEVRDTGIGIAADILPRLFCAFEQADPSSTRRHGGLGLGLAIARRLARLMGGDAGAQSEPGRGSVFWLTARLGLPAAGLAPAAGPSAASGADAADALRQRFPGKRVLVAEDNEINRLVIADLLDAAGLCVQEALDGRAALDLAQAGTYDLVLMDLSMPEMDGLACAREIRRLPGWGRIPILALTANAFPEDREHALAAGMNDFIPKPVEPPVLYATLSRWLAAG